MEAYNTPAELLLEMMKIHSEVENIKAQEIEKMGNKIK
tara:strand:+ start:133 stop:246 length:114 start_codon:yes stop_codon:yes gene_type:complete